MANKIRELLACAVERHEDYCRNLDGKHVALAAINMDVLGEHRAALIARICKEAIEAHLDVHG